MRWMTHCRTSVMMLLAAACTLSGSLLAGCSLLDVEDPTLVEEDDLDTAAGADLLRKDVLVALAVAVAEAVKSTGVLTDELSFEPDPSSPYNDAMLDRRDSE